MLRMFQTHKIRNVEELSGRLWDFFPLEPEWEKKNGKVMVPGCVESLPGFGNYRGWSAYETEFEAAGNICLIFKGVSHFAEIYVDGEKVGEHYGSYTPFEVCIKDLKKGTHKLRVQVDNAFRSQYALDMPNDYMSYGGISRGVELNKIGDLYIKYAHVDTRRKNGDTWSADVEIVCENLSEQTLVSDILLDVAGEEARFEHISFVPGENHFKMTNIEVQNIQTWAPETPTLYEMRVILELDGNALDDWIDRFGFRTVEIQGKDILLNGRKLRIKGFCRHEDHPQYGCALPAEAMACDLQLIKDLGANSVRTSHYPNDEMFLDMCDEMGILVWEENHARGFDESGMKNSFFEPQCEQVIREMITSHYNHPSIYIWGILNECASETEYGKSCYEAQYNLIRSLDSTRPVTSASCKFGTDICQKLPDVRSWNIYPYWYEEKSALQMVEELMGWIGTEENGGTKPFLVSEVGAGGIYGFRDQAHDVWSEELQAEILKKQIEEIASCDSCSGMYIWQFCDVRVSRIYWAIRRPKSRNNKGVVDEYRRPKMAYHVVRELFRRLPDYRE